MSICCKIITFMVVFTLLLVVILVSAYYAGFISTETKNKAINYVTNKTKYVKTKRYIRENQDETFYLQNSLFLFMMVILTIFLVLFAMGIVKGLFGLVCCRKVGMFGLNVLLDLPQPITRYYESSLTHCGVIYDEEGWPIHPHNRCKRTRIISKPTELCVNAVFFFAFPCIVLWIAIQSLFGCYDIGYYEDAICSNASQAASNDFFKKSSEHCNINMSCERLRNWDYYSKYFSEKPPDKIPDCDSASKPVKPCSDPVPNTESCVENKNVNTDVCIEPKTESCIQQSLKKIKQSFLDIQCNVTKLDTRFLESTTKKCSTEAVDVEKIKPKITFKTPICDNTEQNSKPKNVSKELKSSMKSCRKLCPSDTETSDSRSSKPKKKPSRNVSVYGMPLGKPVIPSCPSPTQSPCQPSPASLCHVAYDKPVLYESASNSPYESSCSLLFLNKTSDSCSSPVNQLYLPGPQTNKKNQREVLDIYRENGSEEEDTKYVLDQLCKSEHGLMKAAEDKVAVK